MEDAADEITRLRTEVEDLGNRLHHVHRLWANNEHALRAENERLGRDYNTARDAHDRRVRELDAHCIEITALRAENERLRAALKTARPFIGWAGYYPTILAEVDAALEGK